MATIKAGYRVHVVDGEGVLQGTVELGGCDLKKSLCRMDLVEAIEEILPAAAFEVHTRSESKTQEE